MTPTRTTLAFLTFGVAALAFTATLMPRQLAADAAAQDHGGKPAAKNDSVTFTDGSRTITRTDGRVESADFEKLEYVAGGKKTTIAAADVFEIKWADDPGDYDKGVRALEAREGDQAKRAFEAMLLAKSALPDLRAWVDEYANWGLGEANLLLAGSDPKAADRAVEAFTKAAAAQGKSRILDRILKGLASAEAARKQPAGAVKAADDLIVAGRAARRPLWEVDGNVLKARTQLEAGNTAAAVTAFDDAVRFADGAFATEKSPTTKTKLRAAGLSAAVGKGWAMVAKAEAEKSQAGVDSAKSYFDGLASKYENEPVVLAAAANAEGRSKLAAGQAREAQRVFAKAEVYHFQAADEVAQSLFYQAQCWKVLGDEKLRAERLTDLKELFPTSEWARKAQ